MITKWYMFIIVFVLSCQSRNNLSDLKVSRTIASSLDKEYEVLKSKKVSLKLDSNPLELVPLSSSVIDRIKINNDSDLKCTNYESFTEENEKIVYKLKKQASLVCSSSKIKTFEIEYQLLKANFDQSYFWDEVRSYLINKVNTANFDSIVNELEQLGILELFSNRYHYKDIQSIELESNDFVSIKYKSFENVAYDCQGSECSWTNGREVTERLNRNQSLYKYQFLPPYLLFCGPRYAAADIWFRADEDYYLDKKIDSNGLSCEVNSLLSDNKKIPIYLNVVVIRKEYFNSILNEDLSEIFENLNKKKVNNFSDDMKLIDLKLNTLKSRVSLIRNFSSKTGSIKLDSHKLEYIIEPFNKRCIKRICNRSYFISKLKNIHYDSFGHRYEKKVYNLNIPLIFNLNSVINNYQAIKIQVCATQKQDFEKDLIQLSEQVVNLKRLNQLIDRYSANNCKSESVYTFEQNDFNIQSDKYSVMYKISPNKGRKKVEAQIIEYKKYLGNGKYIGQPQIQNVNNAILLAPPYPEQLPRIIEIQASQKEIEKLIWEKE